MALSRWLQQKNVAETTIQNEFNLSPQLKQIFGKWFRSLLAVVMAVAMFVIPIQTVNAAPTIQFTDSQQALGNSYSWNVSLADVDGDGDVDAFIANGTANKVWLNDGSGNFTDSQQALGNSYSKGVSLADVDGDGDIDAFIANSTANKVWLNDGSGNFTDSQQALGNSGSWNVSLADLDGDGDVDAFIANNGANKVWLNDGSGNFTDSQQALGNYDSQGVSLADVDGDGDVDAFIANQNQSNKVWLNDGSGNFTDSQQALGNSKSLGVSMADLDGDDDIDAFICNNGNYREPDKIWLNDGNGNFTDSGQAFRSAQGWDNVSLADVDGDGDIDAFVANYAEPNKVWLNDSNGNFTDSQQALGNSHSKVVSLADLDGDSDLDVFVANIGANKVWLNNLDRYTGYINYPPTNLTLNNTTINENIPANSLVGTFSTTDLTVSDTFSYQLVSGNGDTDNSAFTIDGHQLKINNSPDYETQSNYSIRVQTTDSAGGTFPKAFNININDLVEKQACENTAPNNLVVNGSFEKPVIVYQGYGFETSIEGWELVEGPVVELNSLYVTYPNITDVYDGSQFVDLDSYSKTTKISQKIPTQPGETYKLTFAFEGKDNPALVEHDKLNVYWGSELVEALDKVDSETTWEEKTYNLTAKSTETVLSFDNLNEIADGYGTRLDGVSLNLCQ